MELSPGERKWPCFSNTRDSDIQRLRPDGMFFFLQSSRTHTSISLRQN